MECYNCKHELEKNISFCPNCGKKNKVITVQIIGGKNHKLYKCSSCKRDIPTDMDICPNCGKKQKKISIKTIIKLFIMVNLIGVLPLISIGVFTLFLIGISEGTVTINQFINVIKYIICFVISIPLIISLFIISGKILKNSKNKNIICLILIFLSIIGFISINNFIKNSKIQFDDYNKQDYILLNNISVPTLYKITNFDNIMIAVKVKINEVDFKADAVVLTFKEKIQLDIINKYKNELLNKNYKYVKIDSENNNWYSYYENDNYMFVGLLEETIVYLSFDKKNYDTFINSFKDGKNNEYNIKLF